MVSLKVPRWDHFFLYTNDIENRYKMVQFYTNIFRSHSCFEIFENNLN